MKEMKHFNDYLSAKDDEFLESRDSISNYGFGSLCTYYEIVLNLIDRTTRELNDNIKESHHITHEFEKIKTKFDTAHDICWQVVRQLNKEVEQLENIIEQLSPIECNDVNYPKTGQEKKNETQQINHHKEKNKNEVGEFHAQISQQDQEIELLKQQIANLTAENNAKENIAKQALSDKSLIIQKFDKEVEKQANNQLIEVLQTPSLIPRVISEALKRKTIEIGDEQQALKFAQNIQALNEKKSEIQEISFSTKEEKINHAFQVQNYEMQKKVDYLKNGFDKISHEREKFYLEKEKAFLNLDKKQFEVTKGSVKNELTSQQLQIMRQEADLQFSNKEFDLHQREEFITLLQKELQIDKKQASNQVFEQIADIKKREAELQLSHRESEFAIKVKEDLHNQKENMFKLIQEKFELKEQKAIIQLLEQGFDLKQERIYFENNASQREFDLNEQKSSLHFNQREFDLEQKNRGFEHETKRFELKKQQDLFQLNEQGFDIKQERNDLQNLINREELNKDQRAFDLSKQEFEIFNSNTRANFKLMKSQFEHEKQLIEFEINKGININENNKRLLQIKTASAELQIASKSAELTKTEIEQLHKSKNLEMTERILKHKKDIITSFQDKYMFDKPDEVNRAYKNAGLTPESKYKEEFDKQTKIHARQQSESEHEKSELNSTIENLRRQLEEEREKNNPTEETDEF